MIGSCPARRRLALLILLPLLIGLAACSANKENGTDAGGASAKTVTLGGTTFNDHGTKDVSGSDGLDLEADSFYFEPTFLRGRPGQTVKLEIENESGTLHNISVKGGTTDMDIPAKGKVEVTLTFPQSGAMLFFCKYHAGQGMNGELLAGDATPQAATGANAATPAPTAGASYDGY